MFARKFRDGVDELQLPNVPRSAFDMMVQWMYLESVTFPQGTERSLHLTLFIDFSKFHDSWACVVRIGLCLME